MSIQDFTFSVSHLGVSRDEALLFKPVSFTLRSGEGLIVEGINGIGKTTLLRVLAGLLPPVCGEIFVPESLAYLGSHNGVKGLLTPAEYLKYFVHHDEEIITVLEQLGLAGLAHKPCAQLSSGQKQRVALARIMLAQKLIWILDEPMTALDKSGEALFAEILHAHLANGGIAVVATHQALAVNSLKKIVLEL